MKRVCLTIFPWIKLRQRTQKRSQWIYGKKGLRHRGIEPRPHPWKGWILTIRPMAPTYSLRYAHPPAPIILISHSHYISNKHTNIQTYKYTHNLQPYASQNSTTNILQSSHRVWLGFRFKTYHKTPYRIRQVYISSTIQHLHILCDVHDSPNDSSYMDTDSCSFSNLYITSLYLVICPIPACMVRW